MLAENLPLHSDAFFLFPKTPAKFEVLNEFSRIL